MPRSRLRDLSIIQNPPNSEETNNEQQTAIGSSNTPNTADESTEIQREICFRGLR
ncbi:37S ribosomal MRP4, mitochondrial [Gossypium arboreum]|uniref:37S ribosomal MRP4, mitochondrial n=1 Tax=Gossypium arboreum TaxID=29729 RepID=A0A0B0MYX4_GOSAR|nr:37S ribosomal MRP4, mitochondrial [Gossypium arboreum]